MNVTQSCVKKEDAVRCLSCGKVLFKGRIGEGGDIEIVCRRCKANNHFLRATSPNPEPHDGRSRPQGGNYAPSHPAR